MPALERGCRWGWGRALRSTELCSVWAWRLSLLWRLSPPSPSSVAPLSSSPSFLSHLGKMALLVHQVLRESPKNCHSTQDPFICIYFVIAVKYTQYKHYRLRLLCTECLYPHKIHKVKSQMELPSTVVHGGGGEWKVIKFRRGISMVDYCLHRKCLKQECYFPAQHKPLH